MVDPVIISDSTGGYWRPNAKGYMSSPLEAGIYSRVDANRWTHCLRFERRIELLPVPAEHPGRLRSALAGVMLLVPRELRARAEFADAVAALGLPGDWASLAVESPSSSAAATSSTDAAAAGGLDDGESGPISPDARLKAWLSEPGFTRRWSADLNSREWVVCLKSYPADWSAWPRVAVKADLSLVVAIGKALKEMEGVACQR